MCGLCGMWSMRDAVHSVRTQSILVRRGPFDFCRFPIGFTGERIKKVTDLIPIHFK